MQLFTTMAVPAAAGISMSVATERTAVTRAQAELAAAHRSFQATVTASLADGTPAPVLEPAVREEAAVQRASLRRAFWIDRLVIVDLRRRAGATAGLEMDIRLAQRRVEESMARRLDADIRALTVELLAARQAGVPAADEFEHRSQVSAGWGSEIVTPTESAMRMQQLSGLKAEVVAAVAAKVAADKAQAEAAAEATAAALASSAANLAYQRSRAHSALEAAQAIPVLQVADVAAAIAALDARPARTDGSEVDSLAGSYAALAAQLENLLFVRQATYNQLSAVRAIDGRAASMGIDVASYTARLDAAARQLDAAGDMGAVLAAADAIRNVRTALDGAIAYAVAYAAAHPPPPPGAFILDVPYFAQIYSLSCEEASLQMALAYEGITTNQDAILNTIGVDSRAPQLDSNGNVVHWGDPYTSFVGDPNGYREGAQYGSRSGYGTYDTAISRAATSLGGHVLRSDERVSPADLYAAIKQRHPSVVWVAWQYSPHATTTYQAWDGRVVMYGAPWEHAVTLVGISDASVLINDPHAGRQWISRATFEAAYAMFDQMAVILN
ncbi:MAG: C39 family peptidase [Candidatus Dormibacteria bacterium]